MSKKTWLLWTGIILCSLWLPLFYYAQEASEPSTDKTDLQSKIETLVKQLGADEVKVREKATQGLKDIGQVVLPALKEVLEDEDPEVAWRARIIIRAIELTQESAEPQEDAVKIRPKIQNFSQQFKVIIQSDKPYQSFTITHEPSGKVAVTTTEKTADGKEETKTYSAESVKEFVRKYPEIAEQYGIGQPQEVEIPDIEIDDIWEKFGDSWGRRLEELHKAIEAMRKRDQKLLEEFDSDWDFLRELFPEIESLVPRERSQGELGLTVEFIEPLIREHLGLTDERGILVRKVKDDSLAEKIDFKEGDIVLGVNGEPIKTIWKFRRLMKTALDKDEVIVAIIRKGKKEVLKFSK